MKYLKKIKVPRLCWLCQRLLLSHFLTFSSSVPLLITLTFLSPIGVFMSLRLIIMNSGYKSTVSAKFISLGTESGKNRIWYDRRLISGS